MNEHVVVGSNAASPVALEDIAAIDFAAWEDVGEMDELTRKRMAKPHTTIAAAAIHILGRTKAENVALLERHYEFACALQKYMETTAEFFRETAQVVGAAEMRLLVAGAAHEIKHHEGA